MSTAFFRALILAASLALASCGGGGDAPDSSSAAPEPTTISTTTIPTDTCMQAGLQIINANNIVQIDQNYLNLEYRTKYSATGTTLTFTTPGYANEVIAVRADGAAFYVQSKSGNTWTIMASASTTITAWLFSAPVATSGNSGFEIYRSDGALAFAADRQYMKPVWSGKVPDSTGSDSGGNGGVIGDYSVTLSAGNYAAALCGLRRSIFEIYFGPGMGWQVVWDGVAVTDSGAVVGGRFGPRLPALGNGDSLLTSSGQRAGGWLTIIDVSNL